MNLLVLTGIAFGLAMDAFAVAIACSTCLQNVTPRQIFRLSFHFGLFQALMPVVGWLAGLSIAEWIDSWDHWAVFGLLALVGARTIHAAIWGKPEESDRSDPTRGFSLVMLSLATSMDALAVGLSFAFLEVRIWYASALIGFVAASMTILGMLLGSRLGSRFGTTMEVLGGLVLIGIGLKVLLTHLLGG